MRFVPRIIPAFVLACGLLAVATVGRLAAQDLVDVVPLVPLEYQHRLVQQLGVAEENRDELLAAISEAKPEHRAGLAFLLVHMPERDLKTLTKDFLRTNVEYAYRARDEVPWGKDLSEEMFLNYVLPYVSINERRDDWRKDFYDRFIERAKTCKTPGEAAVKLNREMFPELKVRYHPRNREKPDQSPYESTRQNYASCTGLSIMLVDACRAVCVPARFVGIYDWGGRSGNHSWTEVWDRQWHFTGAAEPAALDRAWFAGRASKADNSKRQNRIHAVSYKKTDDLMLLPWALDQDYIYAHNVTDSYTSRRNVTFRLAPGEGSETVPVRLIVRLDGEIVAADQGTGPFAFQLAGEREYEVEVLAEGQPAAVQRQVNVSKDAEQAIELAL